MLAPTLVPWVFKIQEPCCLICLLICGTMPLLNGCGGSDPPEATSQAQPTAALAEGSGTSHPAQEHALDEGSAPERNLQSAPAPVDATHSGSKLTTDDLKADVDTSADDRPTAASSESTVASQPVAFETAVPQPSPEQLAKWNIQEEEPLDLLACHDWDALGWVATMAPFPTEDYFVLGGSKLTLWKPTGEVPEHVFLDFADAPDRSITAVAVAADGTWFCAGDSAGQLSVWRMADRSQVVVQSLYADDIIQIEISPSGDEIATLSFTAEIVTWDTRQWKKKNSFLLDTNGAKRIAYVAEQQLVVAGETTSLWNTATGELSRQLSPGRFQYAIGATPDKRQLAVGTEAGLQFLTIEDWAPAQLINGNFRDAHLSFASDRRRLATCTGKEIVIYNVDPPQILQVLDASGPVVAGVAWMPNSRVLVSVTQLGRIRVWGDKSAAQLVQLQPLHKTFDLPSSGVGTAITPAQVLTAVDVRTLPRLPGSQTNLGSSTTLTYSTASTAEEVRAFYHYLLGRHGWRQLASDPNTPDYLTFVRDGFTLFIYSTLSSEQLQVSLTHLGNFDLRTLPKFDGGEIELAYESENSVGYTTAADLLTVETNLLRQMQHAGWIHFVRLNSSHDEEPDVRDLEFYKGAIIARISIRKFPQTPDRYTVQYSKFLAMSSLPVPADVSLVEADLINGDPRLVASTTLPLAAARNFYDSELAAQGWLQRARGRALQEKANWLNYIRGHHELTIALSTTPEGRTSIRVGEGLENSSWQLKQPQAVVETLPTAGNPPPVGMEAADFPLLLGAKLLEIAPDRKELRFEIEPAELLDIADRYVAELAKLGWEPTRQGIQTAEYVFLTFGKINQENADRTEINLRINRQQRVASVAIEGEGLLWNKPLSITPQLVSYGTWLRTHHHPASLALLEVYETEMRQLQLLNSSAVEPSK